MRKSKSKLSTRFSQEYNSNIIGYVTKIEQRYRKSDNTEWMKVTLTSDNIYVISINSKITPSVKTRLQDAFVDHKKICLLKA